MYLSQDGEMIISINLINHNDIINYVSIVTSREWSGLSFVSLVSHIMHELGEMDR